MLRRVSMVANLKATILGQSLAVLAGGLLLIAGCTPPGPKALLQGAQLIQEGDYDGAVGKLRRATELLPGEPRAWNYLGMAYHGQGDYGNAMIAYQQALKLDRNLAVAHFNLGQLFLEKNPPKAIDELLIFTSLEPNSVEGWLTLAEAQMELQLNVEAINSYAHVLQLQKDHPDAYNGLGLIEVRRKNYETASKYFAEALKYDPDYPEAQLNLAVLAHQYLDRKEAALRFYRSYLNHDPRPANWAEIDFIARKLDRELNPPVEPPVSVAETEVQPPLNVSSQEVVTSTFTTNLPSKTVQDALRTNAIALAQARTEEPEVSQPKRSGTTSTPPPPANQESSTKQLPEKRSQPQKAASADSTPPSEPAKESTPDKAEPAQVDVGAVTRPEAEPSNTNLVVQVEKPGSKEVADNSQPPVQVPDTGVSATNREAPPTETKSPSLKEDPPPIDAPVEIAKVEDDLVVVVAETPEVPPNVKPERPADTVTSDSQANEPEREAVVSDPSMEAESEDGDDKSGFLQRINPARLFRRDSDPLKNRVTPLPPASPGSTPADSTPLLVPDRQEPVEDETESPQNGKTTEEMELARTADQTPVTAPPSDPMEVEPAPAPVFSRYQYNASPSLEVGDREAAERLLEKATQAKARADYVQATVYYAAAAEADPSWFSGHYNLGLISYQSGDWRRALSAFETTLVIDPNSRQARYNFALALYKARYPLDAAEQLDKLLVLNPTDDRAHLLLANIYAQDLSDVEAAARHYKKVLELNPRHPQATAIRYWLSEHLR